MSAAKETKSRAKKAAPPDVEAVPETADQPKRRKVKQISQLAHAKQKSMWTGSKQMQTLEMFLLNPTMTRFVLTKIRFTPTFYKIIDEIIVNAIDHWVNYPKKVRNLRIQFDAQTGRISVFNDGPGIYVEMTKNIGGQPMYSVQLIASEFLAGDNLDDDADRKTGGTNGAGLKLTNAFSDELIVHTMDEESGLYYKQRFRDRLETIDEPELFVVKKWRAKDQTHRKSGHTEIDFLPSYKDLGYEGGYNKSRDATDISLLVKTRAFQAAIYTDCAVYYNGELIVVPGYVEDKRTKKAKSLAKFKAFAGMFIGSNASFEPNESSKPGESPKPAASDSDSDVDDETSVAGSVAESVANVDKSSAALFATTLKGSKEGFEWQVGLGLSDGKFQQVSILNGIWVHKGGSHIQHLQNQIVAYLKPKVEKAIKKAKAKFNPNYIINNLFVFVQGSIASPEFASQIKDYLDDPIEKFSDYVFTSKDLDAIWKMLEPSIMFMFFEKIGDKKKTRVSRGAVTVPKCTDAKFAGHKVRSPKCVMIICEGDSARGTVHEGIVSKSTNLNYEYYGTFNINGVPMNARKECTVYEDAKTHRSRIIRSSRLQNNERLNSLVKVIGLDYEKDYDAKTEEGAKDLATLRYGSIVCAMDQDEDGKGNIFGLIVNFFARFWPNLVTQEYIRRLNTPIIRLYPKVKSKFVEEFMSLGDYNTWVTKKYAGDESRMTADYTIKYFKGLGSHKKSEVPQMFKNFDRIIYTYYLDGLGASKLEVYFGHDTAPRKKELATPVDLEPSVGTRIPVSEQLMIDTKSYQRDNIIRKVPSLIDGQVPSRRKALKAARDVFGQTKATNKEMKVNAFVNETSRRMHYHHGEASLAVTVTRMAQDFPGARSYPLLRPEGQFGTRSNGGKDFASPRYTYTKLNQRLCYQLFPAADDYLLEYVYDDGERCEPKYFVPIIPFALMESMELPATGWKVKIWERDPSDIFANVRGLITGEIESAAEMRMFQNRNTSTIKIYKGRRYSVGTYIADYDRDTVTVTELPLSVCADQFIGDADDPKSLTNRDSLVRAPFNETNDDGVKITFHFKEGLMEKIKKECGNDVFDCWEDYLNLKNSLDENINMVDENETVIEFQSYAPIVDKWFVVRQKLYAERIDREIVLVNLKILYLRNIIKFTKNHQEYEITPKTKRERVDEILRDAHYDTFDHVLLLSPKYTKVANMRAQILNNEPATSYNYLINLRYSDMIEEACAKRAKELKELLVRLDELNQDIGDDRLSKGSKTWLKEIDELEATIKLGLEIGWDYGENSAKFR
jgi:DNA topoisomerase-2